jgi:hypothetical protein
MFDDGERTAFETHLRERPLERLGDQRDADTWIASREYWQKRDREAFANQAAELAVPWPCTDCGRPPEIEPFRNGQRWLAFCDACRSDLFSGATKVAAIANWNKCALLGRRT